MVHERFHRKFSKVPESSSVTDQIFQELLMNTVLVAKYTHMIKWQ